MKRPQQPQQPPQLVPAPTIAKNTEPVMRSFPLALGALLSLSPILISAQEPRVARAVAARSEAPAALNSSSVILRQNDLFELRLSGMPPDDASGLNGTQTVGSDGQVNILYAGRIQAAGRTPDQLARAIERELIEKKIFRWPVATITLPTTGVRFVTVGGTVRAPQRSPWSTDLTLLSALSASGGKSDFSGDKINLVRDGKVTVYSYKKLSRDPSLDPKLLPGDRVDLQ